MSPGLLNLDLLVPSKYIFNLPCSQPVLIRLENKRAALDLVTNVAKTVLYLSFWPGNLSSLFLSRNFAPACLNVCVSLQLLCWNPDAQCEGQQTGQVINGLPKQAWASSSSSSACDIQELWKPEEGPHQTLHSDLGRHSYRTVSNDFLLFLSHLLGDILLGLRWFLWTASQPVNPVSLATPLMPSQALSNLLSWRLKSCSLDSCPRHPCNDWKGCLKPWCCSLPKYYLFYRGSC